eukprot:2509877-Rhodomonas_salina.1
MSIVLYAASVPDMHSTICCVSAGYSAARACIDSRIKQKQPQAWYPPDGKSGWMHMQIMNKSNT